MMRGCVVLAVLVAGIAGCASTPQATVARDQEAKAFPSHPATAALYIFRPDSASEDSVLWVDNRLVGATLPGAYFVVHVEPGRHVLNGLAADNGRLMLETRPGEVVFVALRVTGGQSHFERVAPELGRKTLLNCCALLENWAPGQRPLLR